MTDISTQQDVQDENLLLPGSRCFIPTVLCKRGRINNVPLLSNTFPSLATRCSLPDVAIVPNDTT